MADTGVWVKVHPDDAAPGAAVIGTPTADDPLYPVITSSFTGDVSIPGSEPGQAYDVYEFTGSGKLVLSKPGFADLLLVGGGGGGGSYAGGGGGGGGYVHLLNAYLSNDDETVVVGAGGAATGHNNMDGRPGLESKFGPYLAPGSGGGGGGTPATGSRIGHDGASGGGGAGGAVNAGGSGTGSLGNDGGFGAGTTNTGGGGGGAATSGDPGGANGGDGGSGIENSITGLSVPRAGGGGGGRQNTSDGGAGVAGSGGTGGGGAGTHDATNAISGAANTGGGGGGSAGAGYSDTSAAGGSGVVIVRVKVDSESYPFRTRATAPRTAHAARIEDGIVRQVIVIPHLDDDDAKITEYCNRIGLAGSWIDTSYTGSRRGKYAGVGDTFVSTKAGGEFVSPVTEEIEE